MRILWIVNMVLPPLAEELNIPTGNSGTWMFDIANKLAADNQIEFAVACVYGKEFKKTVTNRTTYYCLPGNGKDMIFYRSEYKKYWQRIMEDFKPEVVNIHGTEYCHALSFVRTFADVKTIISLQGILTKIKDHDLGGLSKWQIFRYRTLREWIHFNGIFENHLIHVKNARSEQEMLRSVKYCMAVDDWHYSLAMTINPDLKIYKIDYNLREPFYHSRKWDIAKINRYEITTNPGGTALKGIHNLFKAVAIVKRHFPGVKVKVPGMKGNSKGIIVTNGYSKYLKKLISQLGLKENIEFLGSQSADRMLNNMLQAHIQVVPSSIEGPSLILREGMHLGVPSIATFRGGMADFIDDKVNGFLYDFSEYQYLALRIMQIFQSDELAVDLSRNAVLKAEKAHDRIKNYHDYLNMYQNILSE